MLKPFERFRNYLGEGRFWFLVGMFIITGLASLVLTFAGGNNPDIVAFQTMLALAFIVGAALIIGSRMNNEQRMTGLAIIAPALGLYMLALLFVPQFQMAALGAAVGWVVVGFLIFGRTRGPRQYREAVKAMRRDDFKSAVAAMDDLIKEEPDEARHYRFRAELLRLWGKLGRARRDYAVMAERSRDDATRAVAYNGLAEVDLQAGNYADALHAAQRAYELAPDEWVAAYNLGMIEDRLGHSERVLESLDDALVKRVTDARHRLLIQLYRIRAHVRLGQEDEAQLLLADLQHEERGLMEWKQVLEDDKAAVLRDVLQADVDAAEALMQQGELAALEERSA